MDECRAHKQYAPPLSLNFGHTYLTAIKIWEVRSKSFTNYHVYADQTEHTGFPYHTLIIIITLQNRK